MTKYLTTREQKVLITVLGLLLLGLGVKVWHTGHSAPPPVKEPAEP